MANNSGSALLVVLLIGAFALANSDDGTSSSTSSSSGSATDSLFGTDGDTCDNATTFDSSSGTFVAPTADGNDRGCVLTVDQGSGAPVQALQSTLRNCYFVDLEVDGDFGSATQLGLAAAQTAEGLNPDGNYGPQTAAALMWPTIDESGESSCEPHT
jgi:hypothetical protein